MSSRTGDPRYATRRLVPSAQREGGESARVEDQCVSVEIANAELSPSIERIIEVLYKVDPFVIARLTSKSSLRGLELSRLEELVKLIDLVGIKPQAHIVGARFSTHAQHDFDFSERHHAPVHHAVV